MVILLVFSYYAVTFQAILALTDEVKLYMVRTKHPYFQLKEKGLKLCHLNVRSRERGRPSPPF